jgi:hypothetical protein
MRYLIVTWTILTLSSCNYERVYISDVDKLLSNQVDNNERQLDKIKEEIKRFKIERIKENILLIDRLESLHENLLTLNDSIDTLDKGQRIYKAKQFIDRHLNDLEYYEKNPLELTEETPSALIKLHLAILEGFYLKEKGVRYAFEDYTLSLDKLQPLIIPDKILFRKGENITGRILLISTTDDPEMLVQNSKVVKKMEINGTEIKNENGLGRFQISDVTGSGEVTLTTLVTLPNTVMKAQTKIYVRD